MSEKVFIENKFRDTMGRRRTKSLILELSYDDGHEFALYTLSEEDKVKGGKEYKSLKRVYMDISDPTEYEFAVAAFESWAHWQIVSKLSWMKEPLAEWREELDVKIRSEALRRIVKAIRGGGRDSASAAKYIADKGWDKRRAGKPSKEEVAREVKVQARIQNELEEDFKRLKLDS